MAYTSFTITQPFLGAPLQFTPALGSDEFELLIDCYVTGSASKQDKLSQVTIDFYNTATVDLNTGALTKTYDVFPAWGTQSFEQSPTQSQSSGFSPLIYTPSPGSSATFGDSTYGSISMTPPSRTATNSGRITKKAKKETKKTAEARLPGFSIMTKDGIDVTTSAGRGTKTKEQREHAHLMRQLKACADCKRKKIRCDPSHRRSHNDMSRTSTSSSSSRKNPSPAASTPSAQSAQSASFNSTNTFDDFILFPDDMVSWNPADMGMTDLASQDLSQFNFDINDLDMNAFAPITPDMDFSNTNAFASYSQQSYSSMNQSQSNSRIPLLSQPTFGIDSQLPGFAPLISDQHGLDSWAEPQGYSINGASHTRPHHTSPLNSGQLDGSWNSNSLQGMADSPSSGLELLVDGHDFSSNNTPGSSYSPLGSSQRLDSSWNTDILQDAGDSGILVDPSDQTSLPSHDSSRTLDSNRESDCCCSQVPDGYPRGLFDTIDNVNVSRANRQPEQSAMPTALIQYSTRNRVLNTASERSILNSNRAQPGSTRTTMPFGDGSTNILQAQTQPQRDPQSIHCLARQSQCLNSEPEQASMLLPFGSTRVASAMSSMLQVVLSTLLLSAIAALAVSGYFNVAQQWIGGTTESFGQMSRLAVCGMFVAFLPELFSGSSTQEYACFQSGFGVAFALLSFFSSSGLSDSTYTSAIPSPSKVHSPEKGWAYDAAGSKSFWLQMMEHLSPVQAIV